MSFNASLSSKDLYNLTAGRMKYTPSTILSIIDVIPEMLNTHGRIPAGITKSV